MRGGCTSPLSPITQMRNLSILLIATLSLTALPASAQLDSQTTKSVVASSASWAAAAKNINQQAVKAPYQLNWYVNAGTAYVNFEIINLGTIDISNLSLSVTQTGSGKANEILFLLCQSGIWNTSSCNGNVIQLGKASDLSINLPNLNLIPTNSLSIRAETPSSGRNNYTTSVSVIVPRSSIRLGQISHS